MGTVDPNVEKLHADKGVRSDHHQTKVRVRPRSPLVSSEPRNKMPSGSHRNVERNFNLQKLDADAVVHSDEGAKFRKSVKHQPRGEKAIERTSSLNTPKLLRAKKVARNFVSNNVFFTVVITRPQLEEGAWKVVPKFLDMERKKQNVMLQIENRMWPVKLTNGGGDMQYDRFTSGWSLFAKESKLQAGDICIFELIDPDGPTLEVHITKAR
ncbi:B3 domain-containing transcription factor VRN1-like [Glycine soja]|uniref:B3 domain-containing transcription factor VRN1-like n=1 Tax=Glycine soja TaxID=3848 RepID=UPI001040CB20|nr:B3 domain-containing transcription factor VRN1-like [Glycine soja]